MNVRLTNLSLAARALSLSMCFTVSDLKIDLFLNFSLDKSLVFTQKFFQFHERIVGLFVVCYLIADLTRFQVVILFHFQELSHERNTFFVSVCFHFRSFHANFAVSTRHPINLFSVCMK